MVKIPPLFDLLLGHPNPSRREFLRKAVGAATERTPDQMSAAELMRYLGDPVTVAQEQGTHTSWMLENALWDSFRDKGEAPWLNAITLLDELRGGSITADRAGQLAPMIEEALPRFREYYLAELNKRLQMKAQKRGLDPTDML